MTGGGPTIKKYFEDTDLFEWTGIVNQCTPDEEDERFCNLVLETTIMHPQGGGQPADSGMITGDEAKFEVTFTGIDKETNIITHKGKFLEGTCFPAGRRVTISVDADKRKQNARMHSGGHMLDTAVRNAGYTSLVPTKGNHSADNLFVEYKGKVDPADKENFMALINAEAKKLLSEDIGTTVRYANTVGLAVDVHTPGKCCCMFVSVGAWTERWYMRGCC
ncbi:hypothetical protein SARC_04219 [Sphaeroforma arctica JP610]|uniref:Alanyl-tRNA synthetase class IIc N-terminal domain-containing protein n=1 Tax=Sphaeroforma arctica JP610 TaxID=667725 RepID=A0A0L0G3Y6_9EUKA|nr:hypothetical protein SARC_04219 [Sphaeroforma arctica JP610]KNC83546.1 hypothetical protein SARC_04219 [Sphaeroforma arctica JP610]|eukprot:XP_014157448.1 hypothetical protein SARC_04219 [Sphaeroforma arctica JP610]